MPARLLTVFPRWRWWAGLALVVGAALYLTVLAYVEGLPEVFNSVHNFDKGAHFFFAGMIAFFLDGALARRDLALPAFVGGVSVPLAALAILVPAAMEEYLQRYATFRTSSVGDFMADLAGVLVFIPLSRRAAK